MIQLKKQLMYIMLPFFICSVVIIALHFLFHPVRVLGMDTSIFYMDEKYTLAAFLTIVTAFTTGLFFVLNSFTSEISQKYINLFIGAFFIFLSFDEYFEIHEFINAILKTIMKSGTQLSSLVHFSWIFPFTLFIAVVFYMLIRKIILEKNSTRKTMLVAGSISFMAVLIFELLGSATYGNPIYLLFVAIEEGLEMIGTCCLLYTALHENLLMRKT